MLILGDASPADCEARLRGNIIARQRRHRTRVETQELCETQNRNNSATF